MLPSLIGPENAVKVMIENPLNNNRTLTGPQVLSSAWRTAPRTRGLPRGVSRWAANVLAGAVTEDRQSTTRNRLDAACAAPGSSLRRAAPSWRPGPTLTGAG